MNRNMEILAPAGSPESLTAAVRAGADAVYLGGARFSARAGAKNFDDGELREAVRYCHARGVKVYLAVNTILLDDELEPALQLVSFACSLPVDALLVQDMGLFRLLRERCPELRVHASTQTSVHTAAGARAQWEAGFRRVVLARELSLREMKEIHAACPIELEAFVHGALCMSVSGQCYFSSVLGSRSGNRGLCAQPCRLPFSAPGGTGHDLSLKDLSMIPHIGDLKKAGIVCAKIEGRLKRPEYVAAASLACRTAADGKPADPELLQNLRAVFSRSGFTTGYPDHKLGRDMFGIRSKADVTGATDGVYSQLRRIYSTETTKIPVDFLLEIKYNKPTLLLASDRDGHSVSAEGPVPETAEHREIDRLRCEEQLAKTGGTPFLCGKISCGIDGGLSVPVSELNRLRRRALELLEQKRAERAPIPFQGIRMEKPQLHRCQAFRLRSRFSGTDLPETAKQCELVFVPCSVEPNRLEQLLAEGYPLAVELPRGLFGMESVFQRRLNDAKAAGIRDVWAGTLDGVALAREAGFRVHGGFSLNITNSSALQWYADFGLTDAELSFELTLPQAARIGGNLPRGLVLYGRLPLMLCRNCPAANSAQGCLHCQTPSELTDRRDVKFPLQCSGACTEVLNSVPLYWADRLREVQNVNYGVLRFTTESSQEAEDILGSYFAAADGKTVSAPEGGFTRGLYTRGIQ